MFRISGIAIQITKENCDELRAFYIRNSDNKNKTFSWGYYFGFDIHDQRFMFAKNPNTISPKWEQVNHKGIVTDVNEFFDYVLNNKR